MKKIRCVSTVDYEDRLTKGKIYYGTIDLANRFVFRCNLNVEATYTLKGGLTPSEWLVQISNELNKNIQVL